jgi:hypothetical protein
VPLEWDKWPDETAMDGSKELDKSTNDLVDMTCLVGLVHYAIEGLPWLTLLGCPGVSNREAVLGTVEIEG